MARVEQSGRFAGSDDYLAGPDILGFTFEYPSEYLDAIAWSDQDFNSGGDGHALTFLVKSSVTKELRTFVRKASRRPLVPFARGDNGDGLYCFDGKDAKVIYVIDLGEKPLRIRNTGCANFVDFINYYRRNLDLPEWFPTQRGRAD